MSLSDLPRLAGVFLNILAWLIVVRALLSWFPGSRDNPLVDIIHQITDPILVPLSRLIPRVGMFDFTPMVAIFVLFWLSAALMNS